MRTDEITEEGSLNCDSCLVSCIHDDISMNQTAKQLRCQDEIAQWKRMQLCRARSREAPVFFKHIHKAGGVFMCNVLARKNMEVSLGPDAFAYQSRGTKKCIDVATLRCARVRHGRCR